MNCDRLDFSCEYSQRRIRQAKTIFGDKVVHRILAWALFLLGASKPQICALLEFKAGSLRTLLYRLQNQGLGALEDRRCKTSSFMARAPVAPVKPLNVSVHESDDDHHIRFGDALSMQIPASNPVLLKSTLLCLLNNHLLKRQDVAQALKLSADRVGKLAHKLSAHDVPGILDQRRGQQQDYVFTPTIKGELIQQFVIDIVTHGKISGAQLAAHLEARCQLVLSPRSVLHHVSALGLSSLKKSLPEHLSELKKNI